MNDAELEQKLKNLLIQVEELDKQIDLLVLKRKALLDVIENGTAYLMVKGRL